MEKTFDGDPIRAGDRLWKVGFGPATVIEIRHDTALVQIQGRTKKFSIKTGIQSGETHRTFFWFDPILVIPRKHAGNWNLLKGIVKDTTSRLGDFVELLNVPDAADYENLTARELDMRGLITPEMKEEANQIALQGLIKKAREEQQLQPVRSDVRAQNT